MSEAARRRRRTIGRYFCVLLSVMPATMELNAETSVKGSVRMPPWIASYPSTTCGISMVRRAAEHTCMYSAR